MGEVTTLGTLADEGVLELGDGYRTKRTELGDEGFRILRVADMEDWAVHADGPDHVREEYRRAIGPKLSEPGDVLLSTKGTVGRVAIYPEGLEQVVYSPQMCYFRVRPGNGLHPRYLAYWFKSSAFGRQRSDRSASTYMAPYISLRDLRSIELSLPPLRTQRAIAEVLGALDDKIAANERAIAAGRSLAKAEFEQFSRSVGSERMSLSDLAARGSLAFGDGYRTKKSELAESGYAIVRAADVKGAKLTFPDGGNCVSTDYASRIGAKTIQPGDLVMTTKGTVGRVAVVPSQVDLAVYSPQSSYFRVEDASGLDWGYFAGWFLSDDPQRQIEPLMHKSDMAPYVNLKDVGSVSIPVPDIATQQEIGAVQRQLLGQAHALVNENAALAYTRDQLLPLLMSGRISVNSINGGSPE